MQLWIEKNKPKKLEEFVGNSKTIESVNKWFSSFNPGGALMFCGPTGVGKSLLVDIIASDRGVILIQLNANDVSKEAVEEVTMGSKSRTLFNKGKIILIDEVEGISGRDRGVMEAIIKLIKESKNPVILISSDPYIQKLKSVKEYCTLIKFDKIPIPSIVKAMRDICKKENIEAEEDALKSLAKFSSGDIRSAITDLQIVCSGRSSLTQKDLESIGYREREQSVFNMLQPIFHSRSVNIGRNSMQQADKDADEVFWCIETNLLQELKTPDEISSGYNLLSIADIFRSRIMKQQNWRFKALASDLMASISVFKTSHTGFVMYKPPQRFIQLGRTKTSREAVNSFCENVGKKLHCSKKIVKREYLPYLKIILKESPEIIEGLGLKRENVEFFSD